MNDCVGLYPGHFVPRRTQMLHSGFASSHRTFLWWQISLSVCSYERWLAYLSAFKAAGGPFRHSRQLRREAFASILRVASETQLRCSVCVTFQEGCAKRDDGVARSVETQSEEKAAGAAARRDRAKERLGLVSNGRSVLVLFWVPKFCPAYSKVPSRLAHAQRAVRVLFGKSLG